MPQFFYIRIQHFWNVGSSEFSVVSSFINWYFIVHEYLDLVVNFQYF